MKIKPILVLSYLLLSGSLMAQTVKHFAGKPYDNEDENELPRGNNSTVAIADAYFYKPEGITWVGTNMWVTQNHTIRLFYNGSVYNRGGHADPNSGASYVNATTSSSCRFFGPSSIASDVDGNLYIAEWGNHAIRKMVKFTSTGQSQETTTFAGALPNGSQQGSDGSANGTTTAARFYSPQGIVRHTNGNFYVTDLYNSTIRSITAAGVVDTYSGTAGVQGNKDGKGEALWSSPYGIAILDADHIIVSDQSGGTVRKVNVKTYEVTTIAGVGGDLQYVDGTIGNGGTGRLENPTGIAVASDGRIFVCDGSRIRVIDLVAKKISTYAGSETKGNKDGIGTDALFGSLAGLAYKASENLLYVTDTRYNVIKTVTIVTAPPSATFSASKTSAVVNSDIVTFTNTTTKTATKLTWKITPTTYTISNGGLTNITTPLSIKFTATGTYTVQLDVTTSDGPLTTSKNINVTPAGIYEIIKNISCGVSPNPSNGSFTLQSLYANHPIQSYSVSDLTGKIVITKTCDNSLKETFDISTYQNGFYFLKVNTSNGSTTLKLQKN